MTKRYFVTGTDTDVGKTFVSCAILEKAKAQGLSCAGLKPIAAGAELSSEGLRNEDALALQSASSVKFPYSEVNPVCLEPAIAPHIAAAQSGLSVSVDQLIKESFPLLSADLDLLLIEGAGGWKVPLNKQETLADMAIELGFPVILVVDIRLGCINHTLLAYESILRDGLEVAGWVANNCRAEQIPVFEDNINTIKELLSCPLLGSIPYQPQGDFSHALSALNIDSLI